MQVLIELPLMVSLMSVPDIFRYLNQHDKGILNKCSDLETCCRADRILTKIGIVEEDELLPAVLRHHLHDDLIQIDWWADHQGVVIGPW